MHQMIKGVDIVRDRVEMETVKEMKKKMEIKTNMKKVQIKEMNTT